MSRGILKITVKNANLLKLQDSFNRIEPFVQIFVGKQIKVTQECKNGQFTPTWNETLSFQKSNENIISLFVYHQTLELGSSEIGINTFIKRGITIDHSAELMKEGLVVENEQEVCLELVSSQHEILGSAALEIKSIKQGSSSNKLPIIYEGKVFGTFQFQADHQIPLSGKASSLYEIPLSLNNKGLKPGKLVIYTIRVYLDKQITSENSFISILWGGSVEKTSVFEGESINPQWRDLIGFKNYSFESKIEFKLLDKHYPSEDDPLGYGLLLLDTAFLDGGKFRSQKVDLLSSGLSVGQLYIDCEYANDQGLFVEVRNDPLDLKKNSLPTESDLKKREMLERRRKIMRSSAFSQDQMGYNLFPFIEESNMFKSRTDHSRSPKPRSPLKAVHSIKLPKIDYEIKIKQCRQFYKDSVFGIGMSNLHSAESLRHSVVSYSISQAQRFSSKIHQGYDSLSYKAPSYFDRPQTYSYTREKLFSSDKKYKIVHKSPAQKPGTTFGNGQRSSSIRSKTPGYYQGPLLKSYDD